MNNVLLVNVCDSLYDLSHESRAGLLRQNELVLDHSIEKFAASNTKKNCKSSSTTVIDCVVKLLKYCALFLNVFSMLFKIQIQNDSQFEIRLTKKSFSCKLQAFGF